MQLRRGLLLLHCVALSRSMRLGGHGLPLLRLLAIVRIPGGWMLVGRTGANAGRPGLSVLPVRLLRGEARCTTGDPVKRQTRSGILLVVWLLSGSQSRSRSRMVFRLVRLRGLYLLVRRLLGLLMLRILPLHGLLTIWVLRDSLGCVAMVYVHQRWTHKQGQACAAPTYVPGWRLAWRRGSCLGTAAQLDQALRSCARVRLSIVSSIRSRYQCHAGAPFWSANFLMSALIGPCRATQAW